MNSAPSESAPSAPRPKRTLHASRKILDPTNIAKAGLTSHREAIEERRIAEATEVARAQDTTRSTSKASELSYQSSASTSPTTVPSSPEPLATSKRPNPATATDDDGSDNGHELIRHRAKKACRPIVVDESDGEAQDESGNSPERDVDLPRQSDAIDKDGFLIDVDIQSVSQAPKLSLKDRYRDVNHFFTPSFVQKGKGYRNCRICSKYSQKDPTSLVADVTTCRRHMESYHKGVYLKWATEHGFQSMLPKDAKNRHQVGKADSQQRLDRHLEEKPPKEKFVRYTDDLFREAAIEWLVSTDQPIQAFRHPSFQKMIHTASRATNGVKIPDGRQTRRAIINTFKAQLTVLRRRLMSDAVKGFTQLNNAHNGVQLGQALFKVVLRLGIAHKIGHVTCDNASNNNTMLPEFAKHIHVYTGWTFNPKTDRIRYVYEVYSILNQRKLLMVEFQIKTL
ncbi:hypothetical protein BC827DRAFT_215216 [Russula dissimulans]|nr:hypothetical protein BC827DRAFT_215216 [Russula dissimulans]